MEIATNNLDSTYSKLIKLVDEIKQYDDSIFSESDTRIKIIDRILIEILDWPYEEIYTESQAGNGFIDYLLKINGTSKIVIEAKKDSRDLGIDKEYSGRSFKLNGPVFNSNDVQEGIKQAIYYCAYKSTELACVTNGNQWIFFRGNRLGDGKDVLSGIGFVFSSLESIISNFKLFYNILYYENVKTYKYRAHFQEAEGITLRTKKIKQYLKEPDSLSLLSRTEYAQDFDKIMNLFFKRLSGDEDEDLVMKCFVHTKESELADRKLGRISEELIGTIKKLGTEKGLYLEELIERVKSTNRNEFVIIIGGKGAGKSTFIERFFKIVLSENLRDDCIQIKINLAESEGNENTIIDWLNNRLLEIAEKEVFKKSPSYEELQGMFFNEYERWREGSYKPLYEKDKEQFKIEFGKHIEKRREERPQEYIKRIIRDIVYSRKKVPCLIFDNADHFSIEFQERVFQYARSIYEEEICLVLVPITDKTSWQLSKQGALQSFENEALFLPTPSPKKVIESRIKYLEEKIQEEDTEKVHYFIGKGIKLSISDLTGFVSSLQSIFLNNNKTSTWIGNLSNLDIRKCLEITRDLISSPHLNFIEFIKMYISKNSIEIKEYIIIQAIIKGKYDIYPIGHHKFVQNIFNISNDFNSSPLLCLRILQLLTDKKDSSQNEDIYITIDQIVNYFIVIGVESNITLNYLDIMLKAGLCYNYDPTILDISDTKKISISPSGKQHYYWSLYDDQYMNCMLEITPIFSETTFFELNKLKFPSNPSEWHLRLIEFIKYAIEEDKYYCSIPIHESYEGQTKILNYLEGRMRKIKAYND